MGQQISPYKGKTVGSGRIETIYCGDYQYTCDCRCGCRRVTYGSKTIPAGWGPHGTGIICSSCRWHRNTVRDEILR